MAHLMGSDHWSWKGDDAAIRSIHGWIEKHFPKTGRCERCGSTTMKTDYASIGHQYTRRRPDWLELCRACHRALDGANEKLRGKPLTATHRAKLSQATKGRPKSPEHRAKIAAALRGKQRTAEHSANIAAALKGKPLSAEHRANIAMAHLRTHCKRGHPFDEANTYHAPDGSKRCRACGRERAKQYRANR